jgi:hypothetical protein
MILNSPFLPTFSCFPSDIRGPTQTQPCNHRSVYCLCSFAFSRMPRKWIIQQVAFWVRFLAKMHVRFIHSCPLTGEGHLGCLHDGEFWVKWLLIYKSLYRSLLLFVLGKYLGVLLLGIIGSYGKNVLMRKCQTFSWSN